MEFPHLAATRTASGVSALASAPLVTGDQVTGVLAAYWAAPRELHATERAFITGVAGSAAQALARARLLEAEQAARVRLQALAKIMAETSSAGQRRVLLDQPAMIVRACERSVPEKANRDDVQRRYEAVLAAESALAGREPAAGITGE